MTGSLIGPIRFSTDFRKWILREANRNLPEDLKKRLSGMTAGVGSFQAKGKEDFRRIKNCGDIKSFDHKISRRQTLKIIGGALAAGAADFSLVSRVVGAGKGTNPEKRPNIVFILSDDHRADTMGNCRASLYQNPQSRPAWPKKG